jgi:hypothetical protein
MPAIATSVLLGLGLAASCGLRTFLPLLIMGVAARLQLGGLTLNEHLAWVSSTPSLIALGLATAAELAADKIPVVDHALAAIGSITRPAAGALAAAAAFDNADAGTAALAGLIIGVPTALAVHGGQAGTRLASTATTAGLANPLISTAEDVASFGTAATAILAPPLVPLLVVPLAWLAFVLIRRGRRGRVGGSTR